MRSAPSAKKALAVQLSGERPALLVFFTLSAPHTEQARGWRVPARVTSVTLPFICGRVAFIIKPALNKATEPQLYASGP
jgi:hypothetical protein